LLEPEEVVDRPPPAPWKIRDTRSKGMKIQ
jgi:hypothetical protein